MQDVKYFYSFRFARADLALSLFSTLFPDRCCQHSITRCGREDLSIASPHSQLTRARGSMGSIGRCDTHRCDPPSGCFHGSFSRTLHTTHSQSHKPAGDQCDRSLASAPKRLPIIPQDPFRESLGWVSALELHRNSRALARARTFP